MRTLLPLALLVCFSDFQAANADALTDVTWGVKAGGAPYVRFQADGRIVGNASCNRFWGSYKRSGTELEISRFATTRKYCGAARMTAERAFLSKLGQARRYETGAGSLRLTGQDGSLVLLLHRQP
ncbi:MAG: META domain-containing protein [Pseudomonadota bacterium]